MNPESETLPSTVDNTIVDNIIVDKFIKECNLTMNQKSYLCSKLGGITGKSFNECYELLCANQWDIDTVIRNLN